MKPTEIAPMAGWSFKDLQRQGSLLVSLCTMSSTEIEPYRYIWPILGPFVALGILIVAYYKVFARRTFFRIFNSNDVCVLYQVWIHTVGNVIISIFSIPQLSAIISCNFRPWVLLWCNTMSILSHLPSMLDCGIRTNNTPFYVAYHCRGPYNNLFMVFLCTWVPLIFCHNSRNQFPQNPTHFNVCDPPPSVTFAYAITRGTLMLVLILSLVYTITLIIMKNKLISNVIIRRLNQTLLVRLIVIMLSFIVLLIVTEPKENDWDLLEFRYSCNHNEHWLTWSSFLYCLQRIQRVKFFLQNLGDLSV